MLSKLASCAVIAASAAAGYGQRGYGLGGYLAPRSPYGSRQVK